MIVGRIIEGVGINFNSSAVPFGLQKFHPAEQKIGRNIAIQLELLPIGLDCVYWIEYCLSFVYSPAGLSFRLPLTFQFVSPLLS